MTAELFLKGLTEGQQSICSLSCGEMRWMPGFPWRLHGSSSVRAAGERTENFYMFSSNLQDHLP